MKVICVLSMMYKFAVPFLFAGSRPAAEYVIWSTLHQYLEGTRKRLRAIVKAHGDDSVKEWRGNHATE